MARLRFEIQVASKIKLQFYLPEVDDYVDYEEEMYTFLKEGSINKVTVKAEHMDEILSIASTSDDMSDSTIPPDVSITSASSSAKHRECSGKHEKGYLYYLTFAFGNYLAYWLHDAFYCANMKEYYFVAPVSVNYHSILFFLYSPVNVGQLLSSPSIMITFTYIYMSFHEFK